MSIEWILKEAGLMPEDKLHLKFTDDYMSARQMALHLCDSWFIKDEAGHEFKADKFQIAEYLYRQKVHTLKHRPFIG